MAASGERQQPGPRDGLGPFRFEGVGRASELGQFVRVQEPGDAGGTVTLAGGDRWTVAWKPGRTAALEALGGDRAKALEAGAGLDAETSREGLEPGTGSAREAEKTSEPKTVDRDLGLCGENIGRCACGAGRGLP